MGDEIDTDEYTRNLELKFVLIKQGFAHGKPTFRTITIQASCDLSQLREVLHDKCSTLLEGVDPADLIVHKASLSPIESDALLQQLEAGNVNIDVAEWRTTLLRGLALLSDIFTTRTDKRALHLIVDCTEACTLRAVSRIWQLHSPVSQIVYNSRRLQQGEAKMDISAHHPESEGRLRAL
jgi:hypothetical protein